MAERVKCWIGNYDGKREGLVVAKNQKEAAAAVGSSVNDFRQYWHLQTRWPVSNPKIGVLYTRPYGQGSPIGAFQEGRCAVWRATDTALR